MVDEIVNPYIAGAPVTEARMFFGREDVFDWIQNSLVGKYADHILVIHGQRRVGKTSVLKQLGNRLPKRYIPVFFDLQGRTHTTLDRFLWWLAREIVRVLKQERNIEIPIPEKEDFARDPEYFENQFLPDLGPALHGGTLLLTFDEFDNLEESEVREELARPLIDYLRRLMGSKGLNFIFSIGSSGRKLENMQAAYTDFFKTALYKKISFLSEDQTCNLVTRPVENMIEYDEHAVTRIYQIAGGHPYFTQLTCHELFAKCQRTDQRRISELDVESVLDDVVERGTVNLKFVWDEASDIEKWSLAALGQSDKTDSRALADYLKKQRVRFSESDLTSGLLHLREKDILTQENRFVIHLLRLWLQKNRPIEQVREELTEVNPIANRYIEIGLEFKNSGKYEKAIDNFQEALAVSAGNIQAQVSIALVYMDQKAYDKAVSEFEKALTIDDEDVTAQAGLCEAHLALGNAAMQKGRLKEAAQSYHRALAINEEHAQARHHMAEINRQRAEKALTDGHDEEALSAFADAKKYTPEDETLSERVEAVKAEKKARVLASLVARSEREARASNWEGVIKTLEEAIHLSSEDSNIQKKLVEAREKLREKKLVALRVRAQGLADAEKFNDALKTWQEYLLLKPNDHQQVEEEVTRIKKEQELLDIYNNAGQATTDRNFDKAISLLKEVIIRDENYKDASRLLTRAIELRRAAPRQRQSKSIKESGQYPQPRSRSGMKTGGKRIWTISILLAILLLGGAGTLIWRRQNNLPAISGPFTSIPATPTITITAPVAITPTRTPNPTQTATPIPAWVKDVAEPILLAIKDRPPDFQDDFSQASPGWHFDTDPSNIRGEMEIANGVLLISLSEKAIGSATHTNMRFNNFVLRVDAILHPRYELQCGSRIGWRYAQEDGGEEFRLFRDGSWLLSTCEGGGCVTLVSGEGTVNWENPISITMMVKGTEFAIYLNDIPVTYINNLEQRSGKDINLSLRSWGGSGFVAASLEYDNLKVWDLDKIPNLP